MSDESKPKVISKKGLEILPVPGGMIVYRTCFVSGFHQPLHAATFVPYTQTMKQWMETGDPEISIDEKSSMN